MCIYIYIYERAFGVVIISNKTFWIAFCYSRNGSCVDILLKACVTITQYDGQHQEKHGFEILFGACKINKSSISIEQLKSDNKLKQIWKTQKESRAQDPNSLNFGDQLS